MELEENVKNIYYKYDRAMNQYREPLGGPGKETYSKRSFIQSKAPTMGLDIRGNAFAQKMENTLTFNRNDAAFLDTDPKNEQ